MLYKLLMIILFGFPVDKNYELNCGIQKMDEHFNKQGIPQNILIEFSVDSILNSQKITAYHYPLSLMKGSKHIDIRIEKQTLDTYRTTKYFVEYNLTKLESFLWAIFLLDNYEKQIVKKKWTSI